jgi:hypothetical protein
MSDFCEITIRKCIWDSLSEFYKSFSEIKSIQKKEMHKKLVNNKLIIFLLISNCCSSIKYHTISLSKILEKSKKKRNCKWKKGKSNNHRKANLIIFRAISKVMIYQLAWYKTVIWMILERHRFYISSILNKSNV